MDDMIGKTEPISPIQTATISRLIASETVVMEMDFWKETIEAIDSRTIDGVVIHYSN